MRPCLLDWNLIGKKRTKQGLKCSIYRYRNSASNLHNKWVLVGDLLTMNELNEVVHELNNVLTGILVSSGLLEQRLEPDSPLRRYAAGIREGGESGVKLIRELQAHSKCRKNVVMMIPRKSRRTREGANGDHRDR